jgi:uncharacterized protein (DUF697 family)
MKKGDWLARVLNISADSLPAIRREVENMMQAHNLECGGRPRRYLSYGVSSRLIRNAAVKAGSVGGLVAAPAVIPFVGTIGTLIVSSAVDLVYLFRLQIELCYKISFAYEVTMDDEELKAVTLALLGFSGSAQTLKGATLHALKNRINLVAEKFLKKGISDSAATVAEKLGPRLLGRTYRIIPFIGIPINASVNVVSTMMVGNQARKYFSTWDTVSDLDIEDNGNIH